MSIIKAVSLTLRPLSNQIKDAGGAGYNCDVKVERLINSFSAIYRFNTPEGEKAILSPNTFRVGLIDAPECNHFVEFNGDTGEYDLVTPKETAKGPAKILLRSFLGNSLQEAKEALQKLWPERCVWSLTDPAEVING